MWELIRSLREKGVTIILTTHYIQEAEEMADRIGVIRQGELILVEEKEALMEKLGRKELHLQLAAPLQEVPEALASYKLQIAEEGNELVYTFERDASAALDRTAGAVDHLLLQHPHLGEDGVRCLRAERGGDLAPGVGMGPRALRHADPPEPAEQRLCTRVRTGEAGGLDHQLDERRHGTVLRSVAQRAHPHQHRRVVSCPHPAERNPTHH
jgi:hypothetical protein